MTGLCDIHSHLVPGVDDGAKDGEMSRKLLLQAKAEGIGTMIVTPHNYPGRSEESIPQIKERFEILKEIAEEAAPDIKLYLGNEVFYRESIVEDIRSGKALTMAGSDYVLTEFHPGSPSDAVFAGVRRMTGGGLIPIIAHVERIEAFAKDASSLAELKSMGARLQVNARSLQGGLFDGRARYWRKMAAAGYISFLGSDAHHPDKRPVTMKGAVDQLSKVMTSEQLIRLTQNNTADLLAGKLIT